MRPLLGFRSGRLAAPAIETVIGVLDDDAGFRSRVAGAAVEAEVDRGTWLYLRRPEGWDAELEELIEAEVRRRERADAEEQERTARQRVDQLQHVVEDLHGRVATSRAAEAAATGALDAERSTRRAAEAEVRELRRRLDRIEGERDRAVEELTAARQESAERLDRLRELEATVRELRARRLAWSAPTVDAVDKARRALDAASSALTEVTERVQAATTASQQTGVASPPVSAPSGGPARRVPLRLARGALDGTVEATDQLLRAPGVVVLVDGYNLSMRDWRHLDVRTQRESLLSLLTTVVARTGAEVHVVFDGDEDGRRPVVGAAQPVRVHYSAVDVEADDVIIAMASGIPSERPVVVVSADRRVRDGAAASGANLVDSDALLAWERRS